MDKKALVEGYGKPVQSNKRKYFVLVDYSSSTEQMVWRLEVYKSECDWLRRVSPDDRVSLHDLFMVDISHRKQPCNALFLFRETGSYGFVIDDDEERTRWQALCQRVIQRNRKDHRYPAVGMALEARVKIKYDSNSKKQKPELKKMILESCRVVFVDENFLLVTKSLHHPDLVVAYSEIRSYSSRDDGRMELVLGRASSLGQCRVQFKLADRVEANYVHRQLEQQLNNQMTRSRASWRSSRVSTFTDSTDHSYNNNRLSYCSSSSSSASVPKRISPPSVTQVISTPTPNAATNPPRNNSRTSSIIGLFSLFNNSKPQCNPDTNPPVNQIPDEDGVSTLEDTQSVRPERSSTNQTIVAAPVDDTKTEKKCEEKRQAVPNDRSSNALSQGQILTSSIRNSKDNPRKHKVHRKSAQDPTSHSRSFRLPKCHSTIPSSYSIFHERGSRNDRFEGEYVTMAPKTVNSECKSEIQSVGQGGEDKDMLACNPAEHYLLMEDDFVNNLRLLNVSTGDCQQDKKIQDSRKSVDLVPSHSEASNMHLSFRYSSTEAIASESIERGPFIDEDDRDKSEENPHYCMMVNQLKGTEFYKRAYSWGARTQPPQGIYKPSNQPSPLYRPTKSTKYIRDVGANVIGPNQTTSNRPSYHASVDYGTRLAKTKHPIENSPPLPPPNESGIMFNAKNNCGHRNDSEIFMELDFSRPRTSSDSRAHRPINIFHNSEGVFARAVRSVVGGKMSSPPRTSANIETTPSHSSHSSIHGGVTQSSTTRVKKSITPDSKTTGAVAQHLPNSSRAKCLPSSLLNRQLKPTSNFVKDTAAASLLQTVSGSIVDEDEHYLTMNFTTKVDVHSPDASRNEWSREPCLSSAISNQSNLSEGVSFCSVDSVSSSNISAAQALDATQQSLRDGVGVLSTSHLLTTTPNG